MILLEVVVTCGVIETHLVSGYIQGMEVVTQLRNWPLTGPQAFWTKDCKALQEFSSILVSYICNASLP